MRYFLYAGIFAVVTGIAFYDPRAGLIASGVLFIVSGFLLAMK